MPAIRLCLVVVLAASCAACMNAARPPVAPIAYTAASPPGLILGVQ